MHAQHSQPLRRGSRESAKAHQRAGDWSAGQFGQFAQQPARFWTAVDDATACIEDRPLRIRQHLQRLFHIGGGRFDLRAIAFVPDGSEEHTSELQSLMRISYAVFCLKKKNKEKK